MENGDALVFNSATNKYEAKTVTATVTEVAEDGWPALISSGKLHYLAGWPDEQALTRILHRACLAEGIETDPLPEGLRRRDTATHRFLFNYNPVPAEWGGVTIPPAGVHWTKL